MRGLTTANAAGADRGARGMQSIGADHGDKYTTRRHRLAILDRLDGLRQTGADTWRARCPAHESRGLTLSLRDAGDRILLHCFGGCVPAAILAAVGLELADLFDTPINAGPLPHRDRIRIDYRETLRAIRHDLLLVGIVVSDFAKTGTLDDEARKQLAETAQFILNAAEVVR